MRTGKAFQKKIAIFVSHMGRIKRVIFKLLVILIAVLFIDGGRSVLSAGTNLQILIAQDHINDIELPNHHSHSCFYDDENWASTPGIVLSDFSINLVKFPGDHNPLKSEFHNSIWQPPENS